jgi:hypothetical protein
VANVSSVADRSRPGETSAVDGAPLPVEQPGTAAPTFIEVVETTPLELNEDAAEELERKGLFELARLARKYAAPS